MSTAQTKRALPTDDYLYTGEGARSEYQKLLVDYIVFSRRFAWDEATQTTPKNMEILSNAVSFLQKETEKLQ